VTRVLAGLRGAGHRADRLARERAEADAARYRVAEAGQRLAAIERELAQAEARRSKLADVPARFAAALDDKEAWVRAAGGPAADQMIRLAQERGHTEAELVGTRRGRPGRRDGRGGAGGRGREAGQRGQLFGVRHVLRRRG